jgi:hypothetical protein
VLLLFHLHLYLLCKPQEHGLHELIFFCSLPLYISPSILEDAMADVLAIAQGNNSSVFSLPLPAKPVAAYPRNGRQSMSSSIRRARRASIRTTYSVHSSHQESITPVARWRAWTLLFVFSLAQAIDIFNVTAPTVALPHISSSIDITFAARQWVVNAYSLTFGAFMLTVCQLFVGMREC